MSAYEPFALTRRRLLGAGAGLASLPWFASSARAQEWRPVSLTLAEGTLALRAAAAPESKVPLADPAVLGRFRQNDALQLRFRNTLLVPATIDLRGIGRAPLLARKPVAPGAEDRINFRSAPSGTMLAELMPAGGGLNARAAFVVEGQAPLVTDRDEIMLIEEWRMRPDGSLAGPGSDPAGATAIFTLNRKLVPEIAVRRLDRLRLRFINGSQRSVIAIRIENHDMRVIAIDSRPAEPYIARNGQIALGPGSRIDAIVDVKGEAGSTATILLHDGNAPQPIGRLAIAGEARAAPLPELGPLSDAAPPRPDLRTAQRFELAFDGASNDKTWTVPELSQRAPQAFSAKTGRTIVLALINRSGRPAVFRLNGHCARLLDRLDDGWKPYWLDTIAVDAGQTARVAFVPEASGAYLIEAFNLNWASPLLTRWFSIT